MRRSVLRFALSLSLLGVVGLPAISEQASAATHPMSTGMGPERMLTQTGFVGFYDGHHDTYLSTDSSNKAQAAAMHVNYAPALAAVKGAPEIYLVQGRAAAGQLAVFGSEPGEASDSPIWSEVVVTWKAGAKPVLLTKDDQIDGLQKKGKLTERHNGINLNCPIVKVGK
jgi:hypothetical protein